MEIINKFVNSEMGTLILAVALLATASFGLLRLTKPKKPHPPAAAAPKGASSGHGGHFDPGAWFMAVSLMAVIFLFLYAIFREVY